MALVLAAGGSTRMGRPKMLLRLPGGTVLATVVTRLLQAQVDRVVVVLGDQAAEVAAGAGLPEDPRVEVVRNEDWRAGLSSSLKRGLAACPAAEAVIVALGDQPSVRPQTVDRLVRAWRAGAPLAFVVQGDRPGHPVLFDRVLRPELLALSGDVGARALVRRHFEQAFRLEEPILPDLDTEANYRACLEELGRLERDRPAPGAVPEERG